MRAHQALQFEIHSDRLFVFTEIIIVVIIRPGVPGVEVIEVFLVAKLQYSSSLLYFEWLIIASLWYLALTTVASIGQAWLESRYSATSYGPSAGQRGGFVRWLTFSGGHD